MNIEQPLKKKTSKRSVIIMVTAVIMMFAFGFALVPLYNVMCKQLGINGKTINTAATESSHIDRSRTVTVEFISTINGSLNWKFHPNIKKIKLHPGETKRLSFFAENDTDQDMTVQAIPSVTPGLGAKYFKKTECFCFTQQMLKAHEKRDMPLVFHLDPELPKYMKTLTLSYTLFDITHSKVKKSKT